LQAIYRFKGDELQVCFGAGGRPADFSGPEAGAMFFVLRRDDSGPAKKSTEPAWVELFNGKDTKGWIVPAPGTGKGDWHVDEKLGQLVGRGPTLSYVFTERDDFTDFHLKTEFNCTGGTDSAIFFRCGKELLRDQFPAGYQAYTGFLQPYNTGALLVTRENEQKPDARFNPQFGATMSMFHPLEIIARGNRIIIKIDGKIVTDYTDGRAWYKKGRIALQVSSPGVVAFKKIEIKEFSPEESGWVQLFSGTDFTGWDASSPSVKDHWKVADNVLVGSA